MHCCHDRIACRYVSTICIAVLALVGLVVSSAIPGLGAHLAFAQAANETRVSEKEAFEAAKDLGTIPAWEAFLARFSTGFRAELARAYIEKLSGATPAQPMQAPQPAAVPPASVPPIAVGQQITDPNAPGVAFEVLFGHFRTMATQRYFAAGNANYKLCLQECALSNSCNFWVFQPADPKFVNQGSVDRCFLMSEAGRATPSPWCSGCTTGRRVGIAEPLEANPALPKYNNVRWEKSPPALLGAGENPQPASRPARETDSRNPRCGHNFKSAGGKCVPVQNCGSHGWRDARGNCNCRGNYVLKDGRCRRFKLECGANYAKIGGRCVLKQNCGANQYRSPEGDCYCNKNYEMKGGKCVWKTNKNGFEIKPWEKPGCKTWQAQCNSGNNKACMRFEEVCQPN